jgi:hypothetical protein
MWLPVLVHSNVSILHSQRILVLQQGMLTKRLVASQCHPMNHGSSEGTAGRPQKTMLFASNDKRERPRQLKTAHLISIRKCYYLVISLRMELGGWETKKNHDPEDLLHTEPNGVFLTHQLAQKHHK